MRLTILCSRWLPADRCQLPVQSRVDQRVGTTPGKHGMTLTLETIISESHTKSGNNTWKHGMTLTLETIISESHTKSGNNTWKHGMTLTLETIISDTHKEWEQHLENMG